MRIITSRRFFTDSMTAPTMVFKPEREKEKKLRGRSFSTLINYLGNVHLIIGMCKGIWMF